MDEMVLRMGCDHELSDNHTANSHVEAWGEDQLSFGGFSAEML